MIVTLVAQVVGVMRSADVQNIYSNEGSSEGSSLTGYNSAIADITFEKGKIKDRIMSRVWTTLASLFRLFLFLCFA